MIKEVTETKQVFDREQISVGDGLLFKKDLHQGPVFSSSIPVRIGVITEMFSDELKIMFAEEDSGGRWDVQCALIRAKEVASGEVKIKCIPLEL
ncbi:MAG TPA: hypothetical protein DGK91_07275 [Clostridium sp.]|nr:hypothetical protein [Clostridium sp.]